MVIRESGLIFRGFSVVKKSFHKSTIGKIDTDLRSAMMTAFINFAKSAYSSKIIDYLELKKYCIAFIGDEIQKADNVLCIQGMTFAIDSPSSSGVQDVTGFPHMVGDA